MANKRDLDDLSLSELQTFISVAIVEGMCQLPGASNDDLLGKLCEIAEGPLQVELTGDSIAAIQAAFTAAIETAEWPELEVTLNGEEITVNGTVALDAATLEALEEITVTGVVGLDAATLDALIAAITADVNLSADTIADLVSALEAATLTVTVDGGNITVDGTVDIGNFQDLIDGLQGLEVTIPGTVEVTGTIALDPATIAALSFDYEKSETKLCNADGEWTVCNFINAKDPTDIVGPIYINPQGVVAEAPGDLVPCEGIEDLIKDCPVASQSLFQTYATAEYKITGPVLFGGDDISDKFTLPVDGNNLPALTAFRDELIACLNARGINTTYIQGRDGWTIGWVGEQLTITQDPTNNVSTETVTNERVLCVNSKRDPEVLAALAGIKAEITCLKPDPDCCVPPEGQMLGGAGSDTVTVAGNFEGATELDIVQADGSTETVAVTNTVYNAATNTTTATLATATPVKAVKVVRRISEEGGGK